MSNKTIIIDASEDGIQNAEDIQHDENPNIKKDDNGIENKNDNSLSEKKNSELQKDIDDKSHRDNVKETNEKDHSENRTTGIGAYLRYEFTGLNAQDIEVKQNRTDKLPGYKEIDMIGYNRKYVYKKPKRRPVYLKNIVRVQFMDSEILPEQKVLMQYEPESRNYTVKGMFVMLMITHFFAFAITTVLCITPAREGTILYGHLMCIVCLAIFIIIVIIVACFGICRNAVCIYIASFFACLFLSGFYGGLGGYIGKRIFSFNTLTLFIVDIFLVFLACSTYNFALKATYVIAISASIIGLIISVCGIEVYSKHNIYYWGDLTFPQENWLSYLITIIFTFITVAAEVAELQILLSGEWIDIGENDYAFGGYLMFVSLVDYPIRFMRKRGWLASCDTGGGRGGGDDEGGEE